MANPSTYATHAEIVAANQLYNIQIRITFAGEPYPTRPGANTCMPRTIQQRALFHLTVQQSLITQLTHHSLWILPTVSTSHTLAFSPPPHVHVTPSKPLFEHIRRLPSFIAQRKTSSLMTTTLSFVLYSRPKPHTYLVYA